MVVGAFVCHCVSVCGGVYVLGVLGVWCAVCFDSCGWAVLGMGGLCWWSTGVRCGVLTLSARSSAVPIRNPQAPGNVYYLFFRGFAPT